jgi:hypothetical protein
MRQKKSILLMISSPFQYWCAQEYLTQFDLKDEFITVVNAATFCTNSMEQIEKLHGNLSNITVHTLVIPKSGDLKSRILPYAQLADSLSNTVFDIALLGDLRQIWMQDIACSMACDTIVLVDDGAATNVFVEKLIAPANFVLPIPLHEQSPVRKKEASLIKQQLGLNIIKKHFTLYSVFSFSQHDDALLNPLSSLKNMFRNSMPEPNGEFHFIGSPVSEKGIVCAKDYEEILRDVASLANSNSKLIYFAHRAEDIAAKSAFLESLGFAIEMHDEPYELVCAKQKRIPKQIIGMHSTSLFNMKVLFDDKIDAICYKIKKTKLQELDNVNWGSDKFSLMNHIESIYKRLDEFNIAVRYPS